MGVNKVEFGGNTLIDLTNDTVTPETLLEGEVAHNAAGEQIVGSLNLDNYQTKTDEALETNDKTVAGAINEVNRKGFDKISYISAESTYGSLAATDGIYIGANIDIVDSSYSNYASGSFNYKLPIVAGENITFGKDEVNDVVTINATGGGTDNTILKVMVVTSYPTLMSDIITAIENAGGNISDFNYVSLTGYSKGLFLMQFRSMGSIYQVNCLDAVNGYKIYSEETQNVFVPSEKSIRAFLEEGTPKTMPIIRFVGMPCEGWLGEVDWEQITGESAFTNRNLKFTIEIVGGGALQEGDAIQLCHMAAYGACPGIQKAKPKKRKLRRLFEHTITYEDLDKRFITFEIPYDADPKKLKRLIKWSTNGVNDKTIYFRVRRPKGEMNSGDNGGGMTVDAEFSNVVSVRLLSYTFLSSTGAFFYHIRIT